MVCQSAYQLVMMANRNVSTTPAPTPAPSSITYTGFMFEYIGYCEQSNPVYQLTSDQYIYPDKLPGWSLTSTGVASELSSGRTWKNSFVLKTRSSFLQVFTLYTVYNC